MRRMHNVFQARLEMTGFTAPFCPKCAEPLDLVVKQVTPCVTKTVFQWDNDNAHWNQTSVTTEAPEGKKQVARYVCDKCKAKLTGWRRELVEQANVNTEAIDDLIEIPTS